MSRWVEAEGAGAAEFPAAIPLRELPAVLPGGSVQGPICCGEVMADDGGCSTGCCDDYRCTRCGRSSRVEWPD